MPSLKTLVQNFSDFFVFYIHILRFSGYIFSHPPKPPKTVYFLKVKKYVLPKNHCIKFSDIFLLALFIYYVFQGAFFHPFRNHMKMYLFQWSKIISLKIAVLTKIVFPYSYIMILSKNFLPLLKLTIFVYFLRVKNYLLF